MKSIGSELRLLGYVFNEKGVLSSIKTGEKFTHESKAQYEEVSNAMQQYVTDVLVTKYECQSLFLPLPAPFPTVVARGPMLPPSTPFSRIFMSPDALKNTEKLLLVIQGSGGVRPGLWARSVTVNDGLEQGTIFPYLDWAKEHGYAFLILNPNENSVPDKKGKPVPVKNNESPENHACYCWEHVVSQLPAKTIHIVAHSYGGMCTVSILNRFKASFEERVERIAFTDAVHSMVYFPQADADWLKKHAINWVLHDKPLDTPVPSKSASSGCPCVSAGDKRHEYTSYSAMSSVFQWLGSGIFPAS